MARNSGGLRAETASIEDVLGYRLEAIQAMGLADLLHPEDAPAAMALVEGMVTGTRSAPLRAEWRIRHAGGNWRHMELVGNNLSADPHVSGVVLTMRDVSDRRALEDELRHQAFHDSLTGLANRVLFNERVDHALTRRIRSRTDVAVLLVDVDDFKLVNDTLGHDAGDELLIQVADRTRGCLRQADTAARLGGDEFAVCVESDGEPLDLPAVAQRFLDATRASFRVGGKVGGLGRRARKLEKRPNRLKCWPGRPTGRT